MSDARCIDYFANPTNLSMTGWRSLQFHQTLARSPA